MRSKPQTAMPRQRVQQVGDAALARRLLQQKMHQRPGIGIGEVVAPAVPVVAVAGEKNPQRRQAARPLQPAE